MYNIRAVIMISEATIYAEEVPGLGLVSLFISHCANSHWHTFKFVYCYNFDFGSALFLCVGWIQASELKALGPLTTLLLTIV